MIFALQLTPVTVAALYVKGTARALRKSIGELLGVPAEVVLITGVLDPRTNKLDEISSADDINTLGNLASFDAIAEELSKGGDGRKALAAISTDSGSGGSGSTSRVARRRLWKWQSPHNRITQALAPGAKANASSNDLSVAFLAYSIVPVAAVAGADESAKLAGAVAMKEALDTATKSGGLMAALAPGLDSLAEAGGFPPGSVVAKTAPGTSTTAKMVTRTKKDYSLRAWMLWAAALPLGVILGGTLPAVFLIGFSIYWWKWGRKRYGKTKVMPVPLVDVHVLGPLNSPEKEEETSVENDANASVNDVTHTGRLTARIVPADKDDGHGLPHHRNFRRTSRSTDASDISNPSDGERSSSLRRRYADYGSDSSSDLNTNTDDVSDDNSDSDNTPSPSPRPRTTRVRSSKSAFETTVPHFPTVVARSAALRTAALRLGPAPSAAATAVRRLAAAGARVAPTTATAFTAAVQIRRELAARSTAALEPLRYTQQTGAPRGVAPVRASTGAGAGAVRLGAIGPTRSTKLSGVGMAAMTAGMDGRKGVGLGLNLGPNARGGLTGLRPHTEDKRPFDRYNP